MRGLVGVLHLRPMPGDPRHRTGDFRDVERHALSDAEALVAGGQQLVHLFFECIG